MGMGTIIFVQECVEVEKRTVIHQNVEKAFQKLAPRAYNIFTNTKAARERSTRKNTL